MTPAQIIDAHPRARLACDRVAAVLRGERPDRVPFMDSYLEGFAERYRRERGLPPDASLAERFDHDLVLLAPSWDRGRARRGSWSWEAMDS